jgi:uncharacterized Zn finger protein
MSNLPTVRESEIERRVGRRNYSRGQEYLREGAVFDPRRYGAVIKALCSGTSSDAYRVQVTLGAHGVLDAVCTCPVGKEGRCKHVAAVLAYWREHPDEFKEVEQIGQALKRCSRRELIELVEELIRRRPELEGVAEEALPAPNSRNSGPPSEVYRQQVAALLRRAPQSTDAAARLQEQLLSIKQVGDAFARQEEFGNAGVVYQAIVGELLAQDETFQRLQPATSEVVDACVESLGRCLTGHIENPKARNAVLKTLFNVYRFSLIRQGEARSDVPKIILENASFRDQRTFSSWIRELIPQVDDRANLRRLGGLLLDLEAGRLDENGFLAVCRETGRVFDLARRAIQRGDVDKGIEEAQLADPYELIKIADLLVRIRRGGAAERLVESRLGNDPQPALRSWLERYRTTREDRQKTLRLTVEIFHLEPTHDNYRRVRELARELGQWDQVQPELLAFLEQAALTGLLVRVHLEENEIDRALELVDGSRATGLAAGLELEIAKAAERSRPQEALVIYRNRAETLIEQRGRDNYAEACYYLRKVRSLMTRTGAARGWTDYAEQLRKQHRTLRALLQEMSAANL